MTVLCCPSCGGEMSLDVLISNNELRRAMSDLIGKGLSVGNLLLRYVALFRPAKNRISADRYAKLIVQLLPDLERRAITHKGREWSVPTETWKAGFEAMVEKAAAGKLTLPLENHNYLYAVLVGLADKVEAKDEAEVEDQRRHERPAGERAAPVAAADAVAKGVPEHVQKQLDAIRNKPVSLEVKP